MDRFQELETFLAVADSGGFAKAAQRLRRSPQAVTRVIAALETRLGARLFARTTRRVAITEAGRHLLERVRPILGDLDAAEKEMAGETAAIQGHLTVTSSVTFGRMTMAPIVRGFLAQQPRISVSMLLLDRVANLVEEGIDLALRIGELTEASLIARRVGTIRRLLVASPDYLARQGSPKAPADLRRHEIVDFTGLMPNREWRYREGRLTKSVALAPRFAVNDAFAAIEAAEAGEGIVPALSYMVAAKIRQGRLVAILEDFAPPAAPVHLVYPQSRLIAPKLRAFVDFAAPRLKAELEGVDGDRT